VGALALAVPSSAATPSRHRPAVNLVVGDVSASYVAGKVGFSAVVRNRGDRRAGHSRVATYVSPAANPDIEVDGWALGTVRLRGLKPHGTRPLAGSLPVPNSVPAGDYRVVICVRAQPNGISELYHCAVSPEIVTLPEPPPD
jgi:hypothetical protein